ncbi:MAG: nitroreductase family protein [Bacilli bacterium]
MNQKLYSEIFHRKSFHLFRNTIPLDEEDFAILNSVIREYDSLDSRIRVEMKIVKAEATNAKRGEEYAILFYSEKKENYLQNIGYIGEQIDLSLVSHGLATLWYGIGHPNETNDSSGLSYVIMLLVAKSTDGFRKDMFLSKRKELSEIYTGDEYSSIINIARFAPSACNSQPWQLLWKDKKLKVYRHFDLTRRGIMPIKKVSFYNRIDIGIFLCILELCFENGEIKFQRTIYPDDGNEEDILTAEYWFD